VATKDPLLKAVALLKANAIFFPERAKEPLLRIVLSGSLELI
jgi:hypothetical protein